MTTKPRVRFAPSPTGSLHVGGLRTALFNWLFARRHGGTFILRLEDTDRDRLVPGSAEQIFRSLAWLGIEPDEGPQQGGRHAPYVQSERLTHYQQAAQQLVANGKAYVCTCTADRLAELRAAQAAAKQAPRYDRRCRDLSPDERAAQESTGRPYVVRLRLPESGTVGVDDLVRGQVTFSYANLDDSVMLKSDGFPTYHLANVVDDHAMGITHVIRAEEWLPSLPKHVFLYQAFGWTLPQFAHLSLLLGTDRSKLSKRHGDVAVQEFIAKGYLPDAMLNYLALLGWNPGDDRELFNRDELVKLFSLERVQPSGAVFDPTKLDWMNLQYLRQLSDDDYAAQLISFLTATYPGIVDRSPAWQAAMVSALRDRIHRFDEAIAQLAFVFSEPVYESALLIPKKGSAASARLGLELAQKHLSGLGERQWTLASIHGALAAAANEAGESASVLWPVRVAATGQRASPPVYESTALLSQGEVQQRLSRAHALLAQLSKGE